MKVLRYGEPHYCCIACGRNFLALGTTSLALDEREEWKELRKSRRGDRSYMVNAKDVENMYFHKRPWIWTGFYRASELLHNAVRKVAYADP